ncbi:MAG: TetR/AcrR family transcriptional regulator [Limnohabitans sp.]
MYQKPIQHRAIATEHRFLDALNHLLKEKSFGQLSIDEIAGHAGLTHSAFLKRFGTKKQALLVLYEKYCDKASAEMSEIRRNLSKYVHVEDVCREMSIQLERIQLQDFPANRAMHEDFLEKLEVDPRTKKIFLECVDLMRCVQQAFLKGTSASDTGAFAAAQLLITINYNYVLKAMPALPVGADERHRLIGKVVAEALKI